MIAGALVVTSVAIGVFRNGNVEQFEGLPPGRFRLVRGAFGFALLLNWATVGGVLVALVPASLAFDLMYLLGLVACFGVFVSLSMTGRPRFLVPSAVRRADARRRNRANGDGR